MAEGRIIVRIARREGVNRQTKFFLLRIAQAEWNLLCECIREVFGGALLNSYKYSIINVLNP